MTQPDETMEEGTPPKQSRLTTLLAVALGLFAFACTGAVVTVQTSHTDRIYPSVTDVPKRPIAIVLGASVKQDGTPSAALEDRILTAADLYQTGKVDALLMTGDDGQFHIDEIKTMVRVAREAGVPDNAIQTDGHGYRTYESCKRAYDAYGVRQAIVVTQRFHLGRALYLCNKLGIDAVGVVADRHAYDQSLSFWIRDLLSSIKAFSDVNLASPMPPVAYTD